MRVKCIKTDPVEKALKKGEYYNVLREVSDCLFAVEGFKFAIPKRCFAPIEEEGAATSMSELERVKKLIVSKIFFGTFQGRLPRTPRSP